jgi:hypothetical protein
MSEQPTVQFPSPAEPGPRRRRPWQVALIAAVATLVLVLPIGLYLLLRHDTGPSAQPGTPAPATTSDAPQTSASPSSSGPATGTPPTAPDGRISARTLGNSILDLPPWPVDNVRGPSGRQHFHDGTVTLPERIGSYNKPPYGRELAILGVAYGDVDRDGADETVAGIGCFIEGGSKQLVAFDRDTAGHIVTLGRVVATTGELRDISDEGVTVVNSVVRARVGDFQRCCDDQTPQKWQVRGYALRHGTFRQVSGPTVMTPNPSVTQTTVHAGDLTLGPAVSGYRYGTLAVTVTHGWGFRPAHLTMWFSPSAGLERAGTSWPPVTVEPTRFHVTLQPPPGQDSRTYRFAFRAPAAVTTGTIHVEAAGSDRDGSYLSEAVPWDNSDAAVVGSVGFLVAAGPADAPWR